MDDFASIHYEVRYNAVYLQPAVGDLLCKLIKVTSIDGVVQEIQADHMTLLVYNTLTTLILYDQLDPKSFEVTQSAPLEENGDEESAEDILAQAAAAKVTFTDKKRNKRIEKGEIISAKVTRMMVTQGNVVLYAQLA